MHVTVYTKPACPGCKFTKRKLDDLSIPYDTVELETDPDAVEYIKSLGYSSAPVVVVDLGDGATWTWSGYAPSKIGRLQELAA